MLKTLLLVSVGVVTGIASTVLYTRMTTQVTVVTPIACQAEDTTAREDLTRFFGEADVSGPPQGRILSLH